MSEVNTVPFEEICCGDQSAMQFCAVFFRWAHWIDDILDRDKKYDAPDVIRLNLEALVIFSNNEFFQKNKSFLCPLILMAARSFGDSFTCDKRAADVIKSNYLEVFWNVAYLTAAQQGKDGWKHMSAMTKKYRAFDFE